MIKRVKRAIGWASVAIGSAVPAFAEGTLPTTVSLTEVLTYGGVVITALIGMMVLRKAIKLTNRS